MNACRELTGGPRLLPTADHQHRSRGFPRAGLKPAPAAAGTTATACSATPAALQRTAARRAGERGVCALGGQRPVRVAVARRNTAQNASHPFAEPPLNPCNRKEMPCG